jgi:hypothetical protein
MLALRIAFLFFLVVEEMSEAKAALYWAQRFLAWARCQGG